MSDGKPWVAELTGLDDKYGFARRFLPAYRDYANANSAGSRGIVANYLLQEGHLYEVKSYITWHKIDRYFCIVRGGEVKRLCIQDVLQYLSAGEAARAEAASDA